MNTNWLILKHFKDSVIQNWLFCIKTGFHFRNWHFFQGFMGIKLNVHPGEQKFRGNFKNWTTLVFSVNGLSSGESRLAYCIDQQLNSDMKYQHERSNLLFEQAPTWLHASEKNEPPRRRVHNAQCIDYTTCPSSRTFRATFCLLQETFLNFAPACSATIYKESNWGAGYFGCPIIS